MPHFKLQLAVDHDVTSALLMSEIIDWVMFKDMLHSRSIEDVIYFIEREYAEDYINMIPDLQIFVDMLRETLFVVEKVFNSPNVSVRIIAIYAGVVTIEGSYRVDRRNSFKPNRRLSWY